MFICPICNVSFEDLLHVQNCIQTFQKNTQSYYETMITSVKNSNEYTISQLSHKLKKLKQQLRQSCDLYKSRSERIDELEDIQNEHLCTIKSLEDALDGCKSELTKTKSVVKNLEIEHKNEISDIRRSLTQKFGSQRAQVESEKTAECNQLKAELAELNQKYREHDSMLKEKYEKKHQKVLDDYKHINKDLAEKLQNLEHRHKEETIKLKADFQQQLNPLHKELKERRLQVQNQIQASKDARNDFALKENKNIEYIKTLENKIQTLRNVKNEERSDLINTIDLLEKQIEADGSQKIIKKQREEIRVLTKKLNGFNSINEHHSREIVDHIEREKELENEIWSLQKQLNKSKAIVNCETNPFKSQCAKYLSQNEKLEVELEQLRKKNTELDQSLFLARQELSDYKTAPKAPTSNQKVSVLKNSYQKEALVLNDEYKQRIEELQQNYEKNHEQLKSQHAKTVQQFENRLSKMKEINRSLASKLQ